MAQSIISNFEYIAMLKFASKLRYMADHTIEDVMSENYFKNSMNNYLEAGDEIDVLLTRPEGKWEKYLLEVTSKTTTDIEVEIIGIRVAFSGDVFPPVFDVAEPQATDWVKQYLPGNRTYTIKNKADGRVVVSGLTKEEATIAVETGALPVGAAA